MLPNVADDRDARNPLNEFRSFAFGAICVVWQEHDDAVTVDFLERMIAYIESGADNPGYPETKRPILRLVYSRDD